MDTVLKIFLIVFTVRMFLKIISFAIFVLFVLWAIRKIRKWLTNTKAKKVVTSLKKR